MARDPHNGPAQTKRNGTKAASGGRVGIVHPTYGEVALKLLDNGYEPLPLVPGTKRPCVKAWQQISIGEAQVRSWVRTFPNAGVGLRTGNLVGIDIDVLDPDIAHQMGRIVEDRFGATLVRVGRWPKRLYMVQTATPFPKQKIRGLEILGQGQQFVAFGVHPDIARPYYWATDETPLDVPLSDLPFVDEATCLDLLTELAALLPPIGAEQRRSRKGGVSTTGTGPTRNADGLVIDGRDGWLSSIAFHAVHDAVDAGGALDAGTLADRVWDRFAGSTVLTRGKQNGRAAYSPSDALTKVQNKLSLLAAGRLPSRTLPDARPVEVAPSLPVEEARQLLADTIGKFCTVAEAWQAAGRTGSAPRVGIRATVGVGKSAVSREQLLSLQGRLKEAGLAHRLLVFVPSLALADEAATGWVSDGVRVAVHRGYEARMPGLRQSMCQDLDMVRLAIASGQPVFPNACMRRGGARCHNFDLCAKQDNLRKMETADIVIAAYDNLFTGLSINTESVALMVIDEGCWERAIKTVTVGVEEITAIEAHDEPRMSDPAEEERAWADLFGMRTLAANTVRANGTGTLCRQQLIDAGLTAEACREAAALEVRLRVDPGLQPGLAQAARRRAKDLSQDANRSLRRERLFLALAQLLEGDVDRNGQIRVLPPDPVTKAVRVKVTGLHAIDESLAHLPILHLDATLRPELVETVLPGLTVTEISAAMPNMHLTAVQGSFGKSTLVEDPKVSPDENRRRRNRLQECVDHVRWEAARVSPGRVLVVTYKDVEPAFVGVPGVVTGHFKAIAGLDMFKDVALLIVIGRPLPGEDDIANLTSAYLGRLPDGGYHRVRRGVLMRNGSRRAVSAIEHEDPGADLLRSAVCMDEVVQAIGRGRGVNRTAVNPLEVQVLADEALPLVHDRVVAWDSLVPDIFQRMLLAGCAVDSPADAAALHPGLFQNIEQAKKALQRGVFGGHFPISNLYRDLSLKSARYRRQGRGRSWQQVWWIDGCEEKARSEAVLGTVAHWEPVD
ncbi:bifunctional DNA primase/polymerase [Rhodobacter sp. HX-7-19]|uniref:Bifunctional DNA primase/polymerase n=1 Tax=Paragemmobacter kunshanensis TaxID=2583234 RepID=A0A6M1U2X4_9RHOB|nr:bifunctional DNA primase/polymerase [Rhodobacter kunshanensis]NGQ93296.1 bifunctional DNA primase/polymerase [Rhodobacter kunshanensis]